jgi:hypothetical protein
MRVYIRLIAKAKYIIVYLVKILLNLLTFLNLKFKITIYHIKILVRKFTYLFKILKL